MSLNVEWKYMFSGISVAEGLIQWHRFLEDKNKSKKWPHVEPLTGGHG